MPEYPPHWEADVVLSDGGTVHVRPIRPDDAERLVAFHSRLSPETIYYRFFSPHRRLSDAEVEHFTSVDYDRRCALVAVLGDDIIGVVRYEPVDELAAGPLPGFAALPPAGAQGGTYDEAEVAFVVEDSHQGRGLGSVLLEHIAAVARERGIRRFVAEVLPSNSRMVRVFLDAGYAAERAFDEGVVRLRFDIEPTETSVAVMRAREHRAEARSIARLLHPHSVAVVGASRRPGTVGRTFLEHVLRSGFEGPVYPVNSAARYVASVRAYPSLLDVPEEIDLAVVAVPAEAVPDVVAQAAEKSVHALLVVSAGFAETGAQGRERQQQLVALARANGMRVVGPNSFGIVNTAPDVRINASFAPRLPGRGVVGMFSQSGELGAAILESAARRGLGLSTFVSAGNRADVSGNDLLQFWEEDRDTAVILLYLESFGNPRKFVRLARRIGRCKPVVAVKTGLVTQGAPLGRGEAPLVPNEAADALLRQAGVLRVGTVDELFDVAQVLAYQPLPAGRNVAIVGNSAALGLLAADACSAYGLDVVSGPVDLGNTSTPEDFAKALADALADERVHAVVTVFIPPLATSSDEVARAFADLAIAAPKPVVSTFLAFEGLPEPLRRLGPEGTTAVGSVPSFVSPERAVSALAQVVAYAEWRRRPHGQVPELDGLDPARARALVESALASGRDLADGELAEVLDCYGLQVLPTALVRTVAEAVAAAERFGYPVVLKAAAKQLRHRADLGAVELDLRDAGAVRRAYDELVARTGGLSEQFVVQPMTERGVATVVGTVEDPAFGPLVWFGLGGVATELLGDRAYRILPLTDTDARELVRSVKAAPMLFGYQGVPPVDVAALEDLLLRVARLADDLPEIVELEMNPVLVASRGLAVLDVSARLCPVAGPRDDLGPRRLS